MLSTRWSLALLSLFTLGSSNPIPKDNQNGLVARNAPLQLTGLSIAVSGSAAYGGGGFDFRCSGTDTSLSDEITSDGSFQFDIKMTFPSCQTNYGYKDIYLHVVGSGPADLSQQGEDSSVTSSGTVSFGHLSWGTNGPYDMYNSEGRYAITQDADGYTGAATGQLQAVMLGQTVDGMDAQVKVQISYTTG